MFGNIKGLNNRIAKQIILISGHNLSPDEHSSMKKLPDADNAESWLKKGLAREPDFQQTCCYLQNISGKHLGDEILLLRDFTIIIIIMFCRIMISTECSFGHHSFVCRPKSPKCPHIQRLLEKPC